jgi:hypothetical protein
MSRSARYASKGASEWRPEKRDDNTSWYTSPAAMYSCVRLTPAMYSSRDSEPIAFE